MLILFDIDLTLIRANGVGGACMEQAGRELFGDGFTTADIKFGGNLDPVLLAQMLSRAGAEPSRANVSKVRARYAELLSATLADDPSPIEVLPGVFELLDELARLDGAVTLGLLTGNYAETGTLKIEAGGIDVGRFAVRVWGDDSPHPEPIREHLPPVGFERYEQLHGTPVEPGRVTIIGDTPADVRCARAHGCRSLGVGTGRTPMEVLQDAGADRVVPDLSATDDVVGWLTKS